MREYLSEFIWGTVIILVVIVISLSVVVSVKARNGRINDCIQKTGQELKCSCAYTTCVSELILLNK
jgi:heme exporter protein D